MCWPAAAAVGLYSRVDGNQWLLILVCVCVWVQRVLERRRDNRTTPGVSHPPTFPFFLLLIQLYYLYVLYKKWPFQLILINRQENGEKRRKSADEEEEDGVCPKTKWPVHPFFPSYNDLLKWKRRYSFPRLFLLFTTPSSSSSSSSSLSSSSCTLAFLASQSIRKL